MTSAIPSLQYRLALSLLFAVLLSLSFPPLELGFLAYWALVPLFFLFESCTRKQAAKWGYFAGLLWNLGTLYWIYMATIPGLIATVAILPVYVSIYGWLHVYLKERLGRIYLLWVPAVWVSLEFFRSLGSLGFPWTALAYTQTYYTNFIQYASITGLFGVSLWVFCLNVIIFVLIKERPPLKKTVSLVVLLVVLFIIPWIYGRVVLYSQSQFKRKVRVALIQANIDPYLKWSAGFEERNFAIFDSLTNSVMDEEPELIVWPETATATFVRGKPHFWNYLLGLADSLGTPILTGSPDFQYLATDAYLTYNSVLLFRPKTFQVQSYNKMILVPFGERVPFEDALPFFHDFLESLNMGTGDFSPGNDYHLFELGIKGSPLSAAAIICYESVFPNHVRKLIKSGSKLLVIVTNDGWYGNTSGPYQHAQMAVFRAIENRTSVARCANTGISSFIDPYGRILLKSRFDEVFSATQELPIREKMTFYSRYGDVFAGLLVSFSLAGLIYARIRGKAA